MILALIVSIYGLLMLIRGRGFGKDAVSHPHYRWLGAFLLTYVPVQLVAGLVIGVILTMSNPNMSPEAIQEAAGIPSIAASLGLLAVYVAVAHFWEKAIKNKAALAR